MKRAKATMSLLLLAGIWLTTLGQDKAIAQDAGPTVSLPKEIFTKNGKLLGISISHTGDNIKWLFPTELGTAYELASRDTKTYPFLLQPEKDGTYYVIAVSSDKSGKMSDITVCKVVVGTGVPPKPDDPPEPPPEPTDLFSKSIIDAFNRDTAPLTDKKATALAMAGFYSVLAEEIKNSDWTVGSFLEAYLRVGQKLEPGKLAEARKIAALEIAKLFSDDSDAPVDPLTKEKASTLFTKLFNIYDTLRK